MEPQVSKAGDLDNFIEFLYNGLEGYIYLAAKDPKSGKWLEQSFHYPSDANTLIGAIRGAYKTHEIYIAPALMKDNSGASRENFKVSNVVWADFDGNVPSWSELGGPPSAIVQSSLESNQHAYWRLSEPCTNADVLEDLNKRIAYNHQADLGGWSAAKVLRPPETINH